VSWIWFPPLSTVTTSSLISAFYEIESGYWIEEEGWLGTLAPLRRDLLRLSILDNECRDAYHYNRTSRTAYIDVLMFGQELNDQTYAIAKNPVLLPTVGEMV